MCTRTKVSEGSTRQLWIRNKRSKYTTIREDDVVGVSLNVDGARMFRIVMDSNIRCTASIVNEVREYQRMF